MKFNKDIHITSWRVQKGNIVEFVHNGKKVRAKVSKVVFGNPKDTYTPEYVMCDGILEPIEVSRILVFKGTPK